MTNEKMLEVLTALATCDGFNAKAIAQMTADNTPADETPGLPYRAEAILTNAIKAIKKDIITAEAKKSGNGTRQKARKSPSPCSTLEQASPLLMPPSFSALYKLQITALQK